MHWMNGRSHKRTAPEDNLFHFNDATTELVLLRATHVIQCMLITTNWME